MATKKSNDRKSRIFLSYSRRDVEFTDELLKALESEGYEVFLDKEDIAAGEDWKVRLGRLIVEADTIVFCLSPNSAVSKVCHWEVEEAVRLGKRILPIILERVTDQDLPESLGKLNFIFFDTDPEAGFAKLLSALETDLPWLREHTRLGDLALSWQNKKGNAGILRGSALEDAERWIASQPRNAALTTDLHRAFIAASRKAASFRQRNWIAGAAAVMALSLGLAGWSEVNRREAVKQAGIAEEQRRAATAQKSEAVAQKDRAERTQKSIIDSASLLILTIEEERKEKAGLPQDMLLGLFNRLDGLLEEIENVNQKTDELLALQSDLYGYLAKFYLAQGHGQFTLEYAQKSFDLMIKLANGRESDDYWREKLANSYNILGDAYFLNDERDRSLESYKKGFVLFERSAAKYPDISSALLDLALSHKNVGDASRWTGNFEDALSNYQQGAKILRDLSKRNPTKTEFRRHHANLLLQLGDIFRLPLTGGPALEAYEKSKSLLAELAMENPKHKGIQYDLAWANFRIGDVLQLDGKTKRATKQYSTSKNILEGILLFGDAERDWYFLLTRVYDELEGLGVDPAENLKKNVALTEFMLGSGLTSLGGQHSKSLPDMRRRLQQLSEKNP